MPVASGAVPHLDCRVVANEVDAVVGAVDHVEHALGHTSLLIHYTFLVKLLRGLGDLMRELHELHGGGRHALRGFHDVSVA